MLYNKKKESETKNMNKENAETLATVENISLLKVKFIYCNIGKLNKKIRSKKLKIDSNKKPVIDTG